MKAWLKKCRMAWLKRFVFKLQSCGKDTYIGDRVRIRPHAVSIGHHSFIGPDCWLASKAEIGNWVMLAGRVALVGGDHRMDVVGLPVIQSGRDINNPITIHDDVWIGHGAILLHGVEIGEGAVIGAGAIVTNDVAPYSVVAGNPARLIRMRFDETAIKDHRTALEKMRSQL
jgi:acetyltransferase-like isoleucine patch superfamily enzyme